jgi:hypothetical protein
MKKKISILTLAFLFFASTTGLPLVLHYCKMMESVTFEVCEMHQGEVIKTSCCEAQSDSKIYITNGYDPCCSTKLVDSSLKDNFVVSKTDLVTKVQLPVILFINLNIDFSLYSSNKFYTDTSPPPLLDNHLYLTNSILLI